MRQCGEIKLKVPKRFQQRVVFHFYLTSVAAPDRWRLAVCITDTREHNQIMAGSIRVSLPDNESTAAADEDSCGSPGGSPAEPRPRPQKRRRIPVACGACRSKKSRVSKTEPEVGGHPI